MLVDEGGGGSKEHKKNVFLINARVSFHLWISNKFRLFFVW